MYGCTGYNWSHWNCKGKLKEKSVSYTGKTFDRFTTADSWKVLQCETGSVSVGGQRWVKGSTGKERSVTGDNNNNNIVCIYT
jgi:hypothetical protein